MDEKPFCFEDWETALRETVAPDLQVGYREGMGTGISIGNSGNPAILNMGGFIGIAIGIGIEIARIDSEVDSDFDSDSDFELIRNRFSGLNERFHGGNVVGSGW